MFQLSGRMKGPGFYRELSFEVNELIRSGFPRSQHSYDKSDRWSPIPWYP